MSNPASTYPKYGEIRIANVKSPVSPHRYIGTRPYLIISNNKYNRYSGLCEAVPFTTKRLNKSARFPTHVDFKAGEVQGINKNCTMIVEGVDTIQNDSFDEPIGIFSPQNWSKALPAFFAFNPCFVPANTEQTNQEV